MSEAKPLRVAIVGSRSFADLPHTEQEPYRRAVCRRIDVYPMDTEFVSGGAAGIDTWAKDHCDATGRPCEVIRPDYAAFRGREKAAPLARNKKIAEYARAGREGSHLLAFYDGVSGGTAQVMRYAESIALPIVRKVARVKV